MKELQDQFEAEQYFSKLYKTQSNELRDDVEEKSRKLQELEVERMTLCHQIQMAIARADSEALARSIAEETVADLEKERTIKELELKDVVTLHRNEIQQKDNSLQQFKDNEQEIMKKLNVKTSEIDELVQQNKKLQDDLQQNKTDQTEIEKLRGKLKNESILKQQAVNKLAEIMNRKDNVITSGKTQKIKTNSAADLRKKEKESRRLQLELSQERDKYDQLFIKYEETMGQLSNEKQAIKKLQMEIDCKATEIEHLQMKLNETASLSSADNDAEEISVNNQESVFEGWLSVPNKQNIRRHGWKKQFVVVSSKRIIFYNSETDKQNTSDPALILDLR